MKRITWWPQAFLGLTFNWGALMGWAAVRDEVAWPAVLLYAAGFFWTLSYDTIYAHQDKEDDTLIGVKSTALKLGPETKNMAAVVRPRDAGAADRRAAPQAGMGWLYYVAVLGVAVHLKWQEFDVDLDDPEGLPRPSSAATASSAGSCWPASCSGASGRDAGSCCRSHRLHPGPDRDRRAAAGAGDQAASRDRDHADLGSDRGDADTDEPAAARTGPSPGPAARR